jgi:hypothetical protein
MKVSIFSINSFLYLFIKSGNLSNSFIYFILIGYDESGVSTGRALLVLNLYSVRFSLYLEVGNTSCEKRFL